ncbi:YgjV family protein [Marinobacter sp.]|uniref:YgjV family protein n=1 Tax=Marinobacter sp. TaxID=50741 RepID=UPI00356A97BF
MFDVPNIIGLIALTMTVVALTRRSNRGLLAVLGLSVLLWAVHYGLLGSVSGFMVHLVAAISLFVAHWMQGASETARGLTGVAFSVAGVTCCWYFGTGWVDVLAAVGCVLITMTQFLGKGNTLRLGFMGGETVFFGFALMVGSVPGMAVTAGNFAAGLIGLIRRNRASEEALVAD